MCIILGIIHQIIMCPSTRFSLYTCSLHLTAGKTLWLLYSICTVTYSTFHFHPRELVNRKWQATSTVFMSLPNWCDFRPQHLRPPFYKNSSFKLSSNCLLLVIVTVFESRVEFTFRFSVSFMELKIISYKLYL